MNWGTNTTISSGLLISVFSMVVVFLILLIISYLVDLVKVLTSRKKNKTESAAPRVATSVKTSADDETAMAIAASIATYCGSGIKVKSIKEVGTNKLIGSSIEVK